LELPTTGCGVPPDYEKSYRKIAVAFTPQAGTTLAVAVVLALPAPPIFSQSISCSTYSYLGANR
jgi:hypothetical protein